MGTHANLPDDAKPITTAKSASAVPPQRSSSCTPETPPLIDPTNFRYPRLTPNFVKDLPQSWNPAFQDSTAPSTDIFASPDPTAMYNSMAMPSPSPLFKDFYPGHSPMIGIVPPYLNGETAESRAQRDKLAVVEEMNGLFANLPQAEPENRSDNNFDGSNISSPEHYEFTKESRVKPESTAEQTQTIDTTTAALSKSRCYTSQSSSETRHLLDTSSLSPSSSPQITETRPTKKTFKSRKTASGTTGHASKKASSKSDKAKRPPTRPQTVAKSQPKLTAQVPSNAGTTAFAAANAFAMNPALAGMFPFPGSLAASMSQMYPGAGGMFFQGRPMAFVAGARGPELVPIDMLAQASAVQYGAAQALQAGGQVKTMGVENGVVAQAPYESAGNSRKKRRRQMLERSGCSEEQARENRARALKRLRQKKTVRSQSSTVRYACRKRIAMVRPRVNGRFATKEEVEQTQREALLKE